MKKKLFSCVCESMEHTFVLMTMEDDAFIEIHLSPLPFRQRLIHALGYLFGRRCKWGDFEEIVLTPETALELGDSLVDWASGKHEFFQPNDVY